MSRLLGTTIRHTSLQCTIKTDHPVVDTRPLDAAMAATRRTSDIDRFQNLNTLMSEGRNSFLQEDNVLMKLHHRTVSGIAAVINKVMGAAQNGSGPHPHFKTEQAPQGSLILPFGAWISLTQDNIGALADGYAQHSQT